MAITSPKPAVISPKQAAISEPILEKNRKIGNQTILPISPGINPRRLPNEPSTQSLSGNSLAQPDLSRNVQNGIQSPTDYNQPTLQSNLGDPNLTPTGQVDPLAEQQNLTRNLQDAPINTAALAAPTAQNVGENDLVSNQLNALLAEDSKYLQLARTGAKQTSAARGLLNSTIAAGAGENAAIRNALPIAQQDAATNFSANTNTVNSTNQFAASQQAQNFNLARDNANAGYAQDNAILQSDIEKQAQERDQRNVLLRSEQAQGYNLQRDNANAGYAQDNMLLQGDINTQSQQLAQVNALQRDSVNAGYAQDNMLLAADISEQYQERGFANQLAAMDRESFIQTQRDNLLQSFQTLNIDQAQSNQLETIAANFANTQELNRFQVGAQFQQDFLQASTALQTNWSAEVQSIYSNSEMTPAQQNAAVANATARNQSQQDTLAALYSEMGAWNVVIEQFPQNGAGSEVPPPNPDEPPNPPNPPNPDDPGNPPNPPNPGNPPIPPNLP